MAAGATDRAQPACDGQWAAGRDDCGTVCCRWLSIFSGVNPLPLCDRAMADRCDTGFAGGQPVVVQSSSSVCTPNGTPLIILVTQPRVNAT